MKAPLKERIFWPALTVALTAVLLILGTLQYRWSKEVSDATTTRLRATLSSSMLAFRQDFARELSNIVTAFQPSDEGRLPSELKHEASQFREWKKTASHPGLVRGVYAVERAPGQQLQLLRLDKSESAFELTPWPLELSGLQTTLSRIFSEHAQTRIVGRGMSPFGPEQHPPQDGPIEFHRFSMMDPFDQPGKHGDGHMESPAIAAVQGGPGEFGAYRTHDFVYRHDDRGSPKQWWGAQGGKVVVGVRGNGPGKSDERHFMRRAPWFVDLSIPALIAPVISISFSDHGPPEDSTHWIIVELDQDFLRTHLFPELTARYFPGTDALGYDVAVVNDEAGVRAVYASNGPLSQKDADAKLELFAATGPPPWMAVALPQFHNGQQPVTAEVRATKFGEPPLLPTTGWGVTGNWQLLVKNRQGSLEAAVSGLRQRQLALSFGILLVLAGTMGVVVLASRRAQNLARLQMDFVAGVSHELRTPLAVISSAAENIVDGLVENKQQISRYGKVIKSQSAQLKQLVEQILLFASTRHGGQQYRLQPTDPASAIDLALENTAEVIHGAEITIEKNIEPNLPLVLIDCQALAQCLQNLITNAVKYGGDARWLGVTAVKRSSGRNEVAITISDRGIGIEPEELKHVFDPFYRGTAVRAAQIHGSGLGLPLAKSIIEAMGGRITVESTPGRGSSFTVHLPIPTLAVAGNGVLTAALNPKRLIQNHE